jgi:hypothetical protein
METTYEFTAYNTERVYGYGTEDEAALYLRWLNRDRQINVYEMSPSELTDEQADTLAFNLREAINDLDLTTPIA